MSESRHFLLSWLTENDSQLVEFVAVWAVHEGLGPTVSISETYLSLGKGLGFNPVFSVYSAAMVGVFCALILMLDAPMPALFALFALLISYLITCIIIFGSFRSVLSDSRTKDGSPFHLGLPNSFVLLFCVATLAALFGTYSALGPISRGENVTVAYQSGGVTERSKGASGAVARTKPQVVSAQPAAAAKSAVLSELNREEVILADASEEMARPLLAAVRTNDLLDERSLRSNAWAVRERANLPPQLRLPEVLFGILYGEPQLPVIEPNMVVAKQNGNSTARIMVSFLTAPHASFKNLPAAKTGGIVVVQKRETVIARRTPVPSSVEAVTLVQKSSAPNVQSASLSVDTQTNVARTRPDPVGVASTKQNVQAVALASSKQPGLSRQPDLLLPPVLASIFYGRPNTKVEPAGDTKRAPRLTTLFKTTAPEAIQLTSAEAVTVVAKRPTITRQRHPIELAALADNHRMVRASDEALGGPFSRATSGTVSKVASLGGDDIVTGSISRNEIDSAIRSLRFVPSFDEENPGKAKRLIKETSQEVPNTADEAARERGEASLGRALKPRANPSNRAVTVILKEPAIAAPKGEKLALASPNNAQPMTEAYKLTDDLAPKRAQPEPEARAQVEPIKISANGNTFIEKTGPVAPAKVKLNLNDAPEAAEKPSKIRGKASLSSEAKRRANEEINSALRGAEADLKDTDALLEEIDVIWSDHDNRKRRPKAKGNVERSAPQKKDGVVINPASEVLLISAEATKQDARAKVSTLSLQPTVTPVSKPLKIVSTRSVEPRTGSSSSSDQPARKLLGYIRERGSIADGSSFTDCAVLGADSKLRSCTRRPSS